MVSRVGDAARVSRICTVRWADLTGCASSAVAVRFSGAFLAAAFLAGTFVGTFLDAVAMSHLCPLAPLVCMLADKTPAFNRCPLRGNDPRIWTSPRPVALSAAAALSVTVGLENPT